MEREWRMGVRAAGVEALLGEKDLLRMLLVVKRASDAAETSLEIPASPRATLALLRAARSESTSQALESRAVERHPRLWWNGLIEAYGDPELLATRLAQLEATHLEAADAELVALARTYVNGERRDTLDGE
jgi:hypothetical protein